MKLDIKALAIAGGLVWGLSVLITGLANLIWPPYASAFLALAASIYPGYDASGSLGSVIVGTLYALVDGAVAGAVIAWLYNLFARSAGSV